jgi:16S rRNA (cytosine1402-N4)-methyltransferase
VNRELANLERLLVVAPQCLNPGGRVAIISFHSGEDRIVKKSFREEKREGVYSAISDEPVMASEAELRTNARSRSAKLRWAIRTKPHELSRVRMLR